MAGKLGTQMATTATYAPLSESDHSTQLRKAVIAATIGLVVVAVVALLPGLANAVAAHGDR